MTRDQKVLHSPFDIETHKETFIEYLEVIIDEEGIVHYAVPSHTEFLIQYACDKLNVTRQILTDRAPICLNPIDWLCDITGCVSLWNKFSIGKPNEKQQAVIDNFINEELFKPRKDPYYE